MISLIKTMCMLIVLIAPVSSYGAMPTTSLYSHWKADTGVTESGGAISSWQDSVGSFNATQATEVEKPHLTTDGLGRAVVAFPYSTDAPATIHTNLDIDIGHTLPVSDSTVWVVAAGITHKQTQSPFSLEDEPHGMTRIYAGTVINNTQSFEGNASSMPFVGLSTSIIGRTSSATSNSYIMDANGISPNLGTPYSSGTTHYGGGIGYDFRDGDSHFYANIYEIIVYTPAQSLEDIDLTREYLKDKYNIKGDGATTEFIGGQVVFDGDSISRGYGSVDNKAYPNQAAEINQLWKVHSYADSGNTIATLTTRADMVDELIDGTKYVKNVLMVLIGRNDVKTDDAATVYANLVTYVSARVTAGWEVWVGTLIATTGGDQTTINTLNGLIRADLITDTGADRIVDYAADPVFDDGSATDLTYYLSDGTHLNSVGSGVLADIISLELEAPVVLGFTQPQDIVIVKPTPSATYYIDASVGDGGDGSIGTPWNEIMDADGNVQAGALIKIKGTFAGADSLQTWNQSGTEGDEIVFEPWDNNLATIEFPLGIGYGGTGNHIIFDGGADRRIVFDGGALELKYNVQSYGDNVTLYRIKSIDNHLDAELTTGANVQVTGGDGFRLINSELYGSVSVGIYVQGVVDSIEILNNIIHDNGGTGIQFNPHGADQPVTNVTITGNAVYDNGDNTSRGNIIITNSVLFTTTYVDDVIIANNLIWGGTLEGIKIGEGSVESRVGNVKIYNNTVYDNGTIGISININDSGYIDPIVTNNISYDNTADDITGVYTGVTNQVIDPSFVSIVVTNKSYLTISSSGGGVGTGTDTSIDSDYFGTSRPQGAGYDIGAYEYDGDSESPQSIVHGPAAIVSGPAMLFVK